MRRILFFNDSLATGGTEILLVDLLNNLVNKECHVTLLLPEPSDKNVLLSRISTLVTVKYIHPQLKSHFKKKMWENVMIFFPRLFAKIKGISDSDYDEIVCFKETFFSGIFSRMHINKILWIHNIIYKRVYEINSFRDRLSVCLNKRQLKKVQRSYDRYDQVVCVSDAAKNAYISVLHHGIHPKQNISVLCNALDLSKISQKAKETITDLPQGVTNFILITRFSPEKRIDRLFNAAVRLKQEGYDFHIYIVGEGVNNDSIKTTLASLNLTERITLMGHLDNPYPYILQCKWSLCVSERESFSLALLESMALNTPVITTDCGGPADIVDGGKYGILVSNSTEGVYEGMKSVLDNPSLSVEYSKHLSQAITRFDYQGWLNKVYALLGVNV